MPHLLCLSLCFLLILYSTKSQSQGTLTVKVSREDIKIIYAIAPLEGRYFADHGNEYVLDKNGTIEIKIDSEKPGFIYLEGIENDYKQRIVYYTPGMKSMLEFDENLEMWFEGDNQVENRLLKQLNRYTTVTKSAMSWMSIPPDSAYHSWEDSLNKDISKFENFCNTYNCDDFFIDALIKDHRLYYINLFTKALLRIAPKSFTQMVRAQWDSLQREEVSNFFMLWGPTWEKIINSVAINDYAFYSREFSYYINKTYAGWYLGGYKNLHQPDDFKNMPLTFYRFQPKRFEIFDDDLKEMAIANHLEFCYRMGPMLYDEGFLNLYSGFKSEFPNSLYLPSLDHMVEEISSYLIRSSDSFENITILKTDEFLSIKQLAKNFNDSVVYVDLWATWCKPCIEEFKYYDHLKEFIANKPVQILFVSVDKEEDKPRWLSMISRFRLSGTHILANDRLRKSIWSKIEKEESIESYPRYLILDKKGNIVETNAAGPGSGNQLILELQKYLANEMD